MRKGRYARNMLQRKLEIVHESLPEIRRLHHFSKVRRKPGKRNYGSHQQVSHDQYTSTGLTIQVHHGFGRKILKDMQHTLR